MLKVLKLLSLRLCCGSFLSSSRRSRNFGRGSSGCFSFLLDSLSTCFLDLSLSLSAGFSSILLRLGMCIHFRLDAFVFRFFPIRQLLVSLVLCEGTLHNTNLEVSLQHDAAVRQHGLNRIRWLRAIHEPLESFFFVQLDCRRNGERVVGADFLDEFSISGRAGVCYNNVKSRQFFAA